MIVALMLSTTSLFWRSFFFMPPASIAWWARVEERDGRQSDMKISRDGRGRAKDNIFIERFWRSIKYEDIYLNAYEDGKELYQGIKNYIHFYNACRPRQSLDFKCSDEIFIRSMWLKEFVYICRKKIMGVLRKTGFLQTNFFFLKYSIN